MNPKTFEVEIKKLTLTKEEEFKIKQTNELIEILRRVGRNK